MPSPRSRARRIGEPPTWWGSLAIGAMSVSLVTRNVRLPGLAAPARADVHMDAEAVSPTPTRPWLPRLPAPASLSGQRAATAGTAPVVPGDRPSHPNRGTSVGSRPWDHAATPPPADVALISRSLRSGTDRDQTTGVPAPSPSGRLGLGSGARQRDAKASEVDLPGSGRRGVRVRRPANGRAAPHRSRRGGTSRRAGRRRGGDPLASRSGMRSRWQRR